MVAGEIGGGRLASYDRRQTRAEGRCPRIRAGLWLLIGRVELR